VDPREPGGHFELRYLEDGVRHAEEDRSVGVLLSLLVNKLKTVDIAIPRDAALDITDGDPVMEGVRGSWCRLPGWMEIAGVGQGLPITCFVVRARRG
jgi:hypothetical protein